MEGFRIVNAKMSGVTSAAKSRLSGAWTEQEANLFADNPRIEGVYPTTWIQCGFLQSLLQHLVWSSHLYGRC